MRYFVKCQCGLRSFAFNDRCLHCNYKFEKCDECEKSISHDAGHYPHDKDCNQKDDDILQCDCDNTTCEQCCWECAKLT